MDEAFVPQTDSRDWSWSPATISAWAVIAQIPGDARYREPILQAVLDALRAAKDH